VPETRRVQITYSLTPEEADAIKELPAEEAEQLVAKGHARYVDEPGSDTANYSTADAQVLGGQTPTGSDDGQPAESPAPVGPTGQPPAEAAPPQHPQDQQAQQPEPEQEPEHHEGQGTITGRFGGDDG
jgi:hypothetical protein